MSKYILLKGNEKYCKDKKETVGPMSSVEKQIGSN
jgi:hypothetical protein